MFLCTKWSPTILSKTRCGANETRTLFIADSCAGSANPRAKEGAHQAGGMPIVFIPTLDLTAAQAFSGTKTVQTQREKKEARFVIRCSISLQVADGSEDCMNS
jgi:hypothetical protein